MAAQIEKTATIELSGLVKLKGNIDQCNNLLGAMKIRADDIDESGVIIRLVRETMARCSLYVQTDLIETLTPREAPMVPPQAEPVNEEVPQDGGDDGEPESDSAESMA